MAKVKIDGFKPFGVGELSGLGEGRYYLSPFFSTEAKEKEAELKSNKVFLAVKAVLDDGLVGMGLGEGVGRGKEIILNIGLAEVRMVKTSAVASDVADLTGGMSLCCKSEVGQKKYCKKCGKNLEASEMGKMIKLSKEEQIPIDKEYLDDLRDVRKKPYMLYSDGKGLCLAEMVYPEVVKKHEVDTNGYTISEEEVKAVKSGIKAMPFLTIYKDDYAERLKEFIKNPKSFKEKPLVVKTDFSLESMFGKAVEVKAK